MSHLSIFINFNTSKDEFSSIWLWIRSNNDVMYDFDCHKTQCLSAKNSFIF